MTGCFTWLVLLVGGIFVLVSLIRWFEQTAEAVELGWWNKVFVLLACPFAVWLFPSKVAAGRPTPVPRHEPVRGFGLPKDKPKPGGTGPADEPVQVVGPPPPAAAADVPMAALADGPPPGTPAAFLGMPVVPPKKKSPRPAADPDKIAKLRQKMREQGMLPDEPGGREEI